MAKVFEGQAICQKVFFQKGDFTIAEFKSVKTGDRFSVSGEMTVREGCKYELEAIENKRSKYPNSYNLENIREDIDLRNASKKEMEAFFSSVIPQHVFHEMITKIPNIVDIIENHDIETLKTVNGVGEIRAEKIIDRYEELRDISELIIAFRPYPQITHKSIKKIARFFKCTNSVLELIKSDFYKLIKVPGFGFKKVDSMFLSNENNDPVNPIRIRACTDFIFDEFEENGFTWIAPKQFIHRFRQLIPDGDIKIAINHINEDERYCSINVGEEKCIKKVSLHNLEKQIAIELKRLLESESRLDLHNVEESLERTQKAQGWEYSDEQRQAILEMVDKNVYIMQGLGGTGKTSSVLGFLRILEANGYSYRQCALSGKAGNNLQVVTGRTGQTIHRLLGSRDGRFQYNKHNPLYTNAVVLDELSMVDAKLFLALIRSIPSGSKLVMIGDREQLDAIGVDVMNALVDSGIIPTTLLTQIHRQAQKSAIITHSIQVRKGKIPEGLRMTPNTRKVYGENQDLEYLFLPSTDEEKISKIIMKRYMWALKVFGVNQVQIICPTRSKTKVSAYRLNIMAQHIAIPLKDREWLPKVDFSHREEPFCIYEGDMVICVKNTSSDEVSTPIYNGNTGVVKKIDEMEHTMTIDFDGIGEVIVMDNAINNIQLGYCITIHKSQGSTIPCVLLALPFNYFLNSKELLYTAITRASKYCIVATTQRAFKNCIHNSSAKERQTHLLEFLKGEIEIC